MIDFASYLTDEQRDQWQAALSLAQTCRYDAAHSQQVTHLALRLFDELVPLHQLTTSDRFWLQCAGILHDIGWVEGWEAHHKHTRDIILSAAVLRFNSTERYIVASIARYHRRALPDLKHDHFAALSEPDRDRVVKLAALLRVADGLDVSHAGYVKDLQCQIKDQQILLTVFGPAKLPLEEKAALSKADLLQETYHRKLRIRWQKKS